MLKSPGLLHGPTDDNDVWEDMLSGDEKIKIPSTFRVEGMEYNQQFSSTYCVPFAITTAAEYAFQLFTGGEKHKFSPVHLYHHSGGTKKGSYINAVITTALKRGLVSYSKVPMPTPQFMAENKDWWEKDYAKAQAVSFKGAKKIPGYVRIRPAEMELKKAMLKHGPVMVGVYANALARYYSGNGKRPKNKRSNHYIILAGWTEDKWIIFDSLGWVMSNEGYGTLNLAYNFDNVRAIREFPKNWKKIVKDSREKEFSHCLNHYGKPRDMAKEIKVAYKIEREFKKFNNQSVYEAYGRFNHVYTNAVAYGGYNASYRKFGRWTAGDVINSCYNWRRTGKHSFDFDKLRSEHV